MRGEATASKAATYPRGFPREIEWGWPLVPARELLILNYGRALKATTRTPGKVPVFGTNGRCGWHDKPLATGPGLILGRKGQGPLGVEWCDTDFWVIDTAYYASTLRPDADLKYLYHLVKYVGLNHLKDGTSNPTLSRDAFGAQLLPLPSLAEQKAIAAVLGALDDKIELNRRMSATLEAMARALFQSWFVDFDPVRAKLDGRQPPGLDHATAALFPTSFQDSVLGRIPKGWATIPLYETARWVNGAAFKDEDFCESGDGLPVIKIAELKDGIGPQTKWSKRPTEPDRMIDTGDLLYSWSGSPDSSLEAFLWSGGSGLLNQHIFKVIAPSPAQKRFVYYLLHHLRPVLVETARNKQTTGLGHVTVADMRRLMVCSPCEAVLNAFDRSVAPLFEAAFGNSLQSRTLAALRDTLLPRLLSGELSVAAATEELNGRLRPGEVSSARVAWP